LHERGIDICHEAVRHWWDRFGPMFAAELRKRHIHHRSFSQWRWHLDEVFVQISGETSVSCNQTLQGGLIAEFMPAADQFLLLIKGQERIVHGPPNKIRHLPAVDISPPSSGITIFPEACSPTFTPISILRFTAPQ